MTGHLAPAPVTVTELAHAIAASSSVAHGPIPESVRLLAERVHAHLCDTKGWAK